MNFLIVIKNKLSKRKNSILEEIKEIKKSYQLTSNSKTKNLSVNYLLFKIY